MYGNEVVDIMPKTLKEIALNCSTILKTKTFKVGVYNRVSNDFDEQLNSYGEQIANYKDIIDDIDIWEFADIYIDNNFNAENSKDELNRLIADVKLGLINIVVTKSISHFGESVTETLRYVKLLQDENVNIVFEEECIDTFSMNIEVLLSLLYALSQQEVKTLSENAEAKLKMQSNEIFNFDPQDENGQKIKPLSINKHEPDVIRYIFDRYTNGAGCLLIAKELVAMNYRNKNYLGNLTAKELGLTNVDDTDDVTEKKGFENKDSAVTADSNSKKSVLSKDISENIFAGKIECGFCGLPYVEKNDNWYCLNYIDLHDETKCVCSHESTCDVDNAVLENAFIEAFNLLCNTHGEAIFDFLNTMEENLKAKTTRQKVAELNEEVVLLENKVNKLLDLHLEDKISKLDYEAKYLKLKSELTDKQKEKLEVQIISDTQREIEKHIVSIRSLFEREEELANFDREIFKDIVKKIVIGTVYPEDNLVDANVFTFIFKTGLITEIKINMLDL